MSDGEMLAVWVVVTVVASIVLAGLAGRSAAYAGWGLIGPIGIAVAAVHGAEGRVLEQLWAVKRQLAARGQSATSTIPSASATTGGLVAPGTVLSQVVCPHRRAKWDEVKTDRFGDWRYGDCHSCVTPQSAKPPFVASDAARPNELTEHPCPNCGASLVYPKSEEGGRVPCAGCGINALFGSGSPNE